MLDPEPTTERDICYDGVQFFELDDNDEPTHDPYAGDPLDVRNSGVGGNAPQEPQGCLCGDPEFEPA